MTSCINCGRVTNVLDIEGLCSDCSLDGVEWCDTCDDFAANCDHPDDGGDIFDAEEERAWDDVEDLPKAWVSRSSDPVEGSNYHYHEDD